MNVVFVTNNSHWNVAKTQKCPNHDPIGCQKRKKNIWGIFNVEQLWQMFFVAFTSRRIWSLVFVNCYRFIMVVFLCQRKQKKNVSFGVIVVSIISMPMLFFIFNLNQCFFKLKKVNAPRETKKKCWCEKSRAKRKKKSGVWLYK